MTNNNILFIDDEYNSISSMSRLLKKNYNIQTAQSGKEALEIINNCNPFSVIISDLKMPEMDGISLLSKVKEISPDTSRILFTGHANLKNAIDAVNNGYVFRIMTKPSSEDEIKKSIDAGINQYHLIKSRAELEHLKKISSSMKKVIQGFASIVEARDPYTAGHQRRVAELSVSIAEKLGLDDHTMDGINMAAMIHDLGKLYVPAEFLNKPGKLSDAEFEIIKSHSNVGSDVLCPVEFPWPICSIVKQHHERINGSGYPLGLDGDEILIEARVISVADVMEAMTFHRPYRPGLGIEAAVEEIKKNRGIHYDQDVVDACNEIFSDRGFSRDWVK